MSKGSQLSKKEELVKQMSRIVGIYDLDFMSYENIIPNLECAKLATWYRRKHTVASLAPSLSPEMYSKMHVRKEYDDGVYPEDLFKSNVEYGGRAFTSGEYIPLASEVESIIPDMEMYNKFKENFGVTKSGQYLFNRITKAAHIRVAPNNTIDEEYIETLYSILKVRQNDFSGIILHDYNLGSVPAAVEALQYLSCSRNYITKTGIRPFQIGNKYPIVLNSLEQLKDWVSIPIFPKVLFIQYDGLMDHDTLIELIKNHSKFAIRLYYNPAEAQSSENHFIEKLSLEIFKQVLLLRRKGFKMLLYYDDSQFIRPEIKIFLDLINCWLRFTYNDKLPPGYQTLYRFCRQYRKFQYRSWAFYKIVTVSLKDMRKMFSFFRKHNYQLFQMFYEWDKVELYKGDIINVKKR